MKPPIAAINPVPNVGAVKRSPMASGAPSNEPMSGRTRSKLGLPASPARPFGAAAKLIGKGSR